MIQRLMILCIIICGITLNARIGDTYEQSVKRYGKPLNYFKDEYRDAGLFCRENLVILVLYRQGYSVEERFAVLKTEKKYHFLNEKNAQGKSRLLSSYNKNTLPIKPPLIKQILNSQGTGWSMDDKQLLNQSEYSAQTNKLKLNAVYYNKNMFLIVKDVSSAPSLSVPVNLIQTENICINPTSSYIEYEEKYGIPISHIQVINQFFPYYQKGRFLIKASFMTAKYKFKRTQEEKKKGNSIVDNAIGAKSFATCYYLLKNDVVKKYSKKITEWRQQFTQFSFQKKDYNDKNDYFFRNKSFKFTQRQNIISIPHVLVMSMLEKLTSSKWTPLAPNSFAQNTYATWAFNRCLHASYDIFEKELEISTYCPSDQDNHCAKKQSKAYPINLKPKKEKRAMNNPFRDIKDSPAFLNATENLYNNLLKIKYFLNARGISGKIKNWEPGVISPTIVFDVPEKKVPTQIMVSLSRNTHNQMEITIKSTLKIPFKLNYSDKLKLLKFINKWKNNSCLPYSIVLREEHQDILFYKSIRIDKDKLLSTDIIGIKIYKMSRDCPEFYSDIKKSRVIPLTQKIKGK